MTRPGFLVVPAAAVPLTFQLPLQRWFADLAVAQARSPRAAEPLLVPLDRQLAPGAPLQPDEQAHLHAVGPLAALACQAQVAAGIWRRNGLEAAGSAATYRSAQAGEVLIGADQVARLRVLLVRDSSRRFSTHALTRAAARAPGPAAGAGAGAVRARGLLPAGARPG